MFVFFILDFSHSMGNVSVRVCVENIVTRFQSTMSDFCRISSTRGWIRLCGGCLGIPTTIQLTAAVVQTWRRPQPTPTGMSVLLKLYKSLVRPRFRYRVSAWSPHYAKGKSLLERL